MREQSIAGNVFRELEGIFSCKKKKLRIKYLIRSRGVGGD